MGLLWYFLGRVLAFTFRGSVRQTDSWQIIAGGTALPSLALGVIYGLLGQDMPTIEQAEWATYFGYGLVTWLAIRFLIAPFFVWRDQYNEAAELRLELTRPERMVLEQLARHRAKARAKLAAKLEDFQTLSFMECSEETLNVYNGLAGPKMAGIRKLQASAGLSEAFDTGRGRFLALVHQEVMVPNDDLDLHRKSEEVLKLLQRHLIGDLTAEALALQLPTDIEPRKRQ